MARGIQSYDLPYFGSSYERLIMIFALDETCLAGDGVVAFMFQINRALSLIGLYFLLLPFSIISCLPGVSLHVFFLNFVGFCGGIYFTFLLMLLAPVF